MWVFVVTEKFRYALAFSVHGAELSEPSGLHVAEPRVRAILQRGIQAFSLVKEVQMLAGKQCNPKVSPWSSGFF